MRRIRTALLLAVPTLLPSGSPPVPQPAVLVDVHFRLLSSDGTPLADAPVRLVLGAAAGWQDARAGLGRRTDGHGECRFQATAVLETRQRKLPSNFTTQLLSPAQETRHLAVAVELPYLGRPWLYQAAVDLFADGTSAQLDGLRVFGADRRGGFTVAAVRKDGGWLLPGTEAALRLPGHEVARFALEPSAGGASWKVFLMVKRHPEPVLR